jgi:chaperone BCS1
MNYQDNQFVVGMMFTTILAATLAYMRNVPQRLWSYFWAQFAVSAEVKNTDPAFNWLAVWLDQQPYSKKTRRLTVYTHHKDDDDDDSDYDVIGRKKKSRPRVLFTPAPGEHLFFYKGKLVWLSRIKSDAAASNNPVSGTNTQLERESFMIWVLGRSQQLLREIIQDAMDLALPEGSPETCVIPSVDGRWQSAIHRRPRTKGSVILENNGLEGLIDDAQKFLQNKTWYDDLGIPYRRGYLLYGVPGAGKTSAVLAVAGELGLDVYMLNLGDRYLDDSRLNYLLSQVPPGNIVLLEDIDAAFAQAKDPVNSSKSSRGKREIADAQITFSGLLNALDGVAAREGRLLFMTTNHKEILDPALVRPGRADIHVEFKHATPSQAEKMFLRFFPDADPQLAMRFGYLTPRDDVSMATIQDHLITHKHDAEVALAAWADAHQCV